MHHDEIAVGDGALDVGAELRVLGEARLECAAQEFLAVRGAHVVLDVVGVDVLERFVHLVLVHQQVVHRDDDAAIGFLRPGFREGVGSVVCPDVRRRDAEHRQRHRDRDSSLHGFAPCSVAGGAGRGYGVEPSSPRTIFAPCTIDSSFA
jgi:hypothetical protein